MTRMDARRLAPEAQEDLRRRVVYSVREDGMSDSEAARTFGVCRQSVGKWVARAEAGGTRALAARKRGPKPVPRMSAGAERGVVRAIRGGCPDRLGLPFALWTRDAVVALIRRRTGRVVSVWTAGRYLRRWGMTPQRPRRRAYERDPAAVRAWLTGQYPAIRRRPHAGGAGGRQAVRVQHDLGDQQPRTTAIHGVRRPAEREAVHRVPRAAAAGHSGPQAVPGRRLPPGAHGRGGDGVARRETRALGPAGVVLPAGVQPGLEPRRVPEPGHEAGDEEGPPGRPAGDDGERAQPPSSPPAGAGSCEAFLPRATRSLRRSVTR